MTYGIITEESTAEGDFAEHGYEFQDQPYASVRALVEDSDVQYKSWSEWSSSDAGPGEWISGEAKQDMHTGDWTEYGLHVSHCDGSPMTWGEMWFLKKRLELYGKIAPKSVFDEAQRMWRATRQRAVP